MQGNVELSKEELLDGFKLIAGTTSAKKAAETITNGSIYTGITFTERTIISL